MSTEESETRMMELERELASWSKNKRIKVSLIIIGYAEKGMARSYLLTDHDEEELKDINNMVELMKLGVTND